MLQATVPLLLSWGNFYVIIGAAAASLTALMFIVITFIVSVRKQGGSEVFAAFGTPTVVHFCVSLLIAAIFSAPWHALWNIAILLGLIGLAGMTYVAIITWRMGHQTSYKPVMEDWLWHATFPLLSYTALTVATVLLLVAPILALFIIGGVTVLLLFVGIHNAWDTVTYIALEQAPTQNDSKEETNSPTVQNTGK